MSLWTPDGERPIPRQGTPAEAPSTQPPQAPPPGQPQEPQLTPEQEAQAQAMAHELAEARDRLLGTDVGTVLANHAMGIYELAAIHLTADEPKMSEAQTAIDALAALLGELNGRLGEAEPTLLEALHQIRLAFVQRQSQMEAEQGA